MAPRRREETSRLARRPVLLAFCGAVVLATALIAASLLGGRTSATKAAPEPQPAPAGRDSLFRNVPQQGIVLGRPDAPVTLVEFADLQCPFCAQWARDAFPAIVDEYVRNGRVRVVFRGLSFIGPDSEKALRSALAAAEQDRLWDVVHGLFVNLGGENDGWVTDDLLHSFAGTGLDTRRMLARTGSSWVEQQLREARSAADAVGVPGTPFFQAGPTGQTLEPLHVSALDAETFRRELDRLLAA